MLETRRAARTAWYSALYELTRVVAGRLDDAATLQALAPLLGRLLDVRHALVLAGRGQAIRTIDYLATCAKEGDPPSSYARGLRYALTVPMQAGGRVLGTLSSWSAERAYSRADEEFVSAIGALLALRLTCPSAR